MLFSIPRVTAERIARLGLACDSGNSPLSHIGLRVCPTQARFTATDGKLLASLIVPLDDFQGTPSEIILDQTQLAAAIKLTAKAVGNKITFKIEDNEARISNGTIAAVARLINGQYPQIGHVFARATGRRWVPTMSSINPQLVATAQKIIGTKNPILFSSPVDPAMRLERLWDRGREEHSETVSITDLRAAVNSPAYWSDHELAILIMNVARSDSERQLDLSAHAAPLPQTAQAA